MSQRFEQPATLLLTAAGFLVSWLSGFSVGRYIMVVPLLVTAFAITRGRNGSQVVAAMIVAVAIWVAFAFLFFGTILLEQALLIEVGLCALAYLMFFAYRFSR